MSDKNDYSNDPKDSPPNSKMAAKQPGNDVASIFAKIVDQLQYKLAEQEDESMSVDIELTFKNVAVDEHGFPLFSNKTVSDSTEIRLASRVRRVPLDNLKNSRQE